MTKDKFITGFIAGFKERELQLKRERLSIQAITNPREDKVEEIEFELYESQYCDYKELEKQETEKYSK